MGGNGNSNGLRGSVKLGAFHFDIFDRASGIIAHGTTVGEDVVEAHSHVQRRYRLTIDAAKLFVN